jgi:hypothetical protein
VCTIQEENIMFFKYFLPDLLEIIIINYIK